MIEYTNVQFHVQNQKHRKLFEIGEGAKRLKALIRTFILCIVQALPKNWDNTAFLPPAPMSLQNSKKTNRKT